METPGKYTRVARLLVKELEGALSLPEREELEAWKAADERHRLLYRKITSPSFLENKLEEMKSIDHVSAWLAIEARRSARSRLRLLRRVSAAAAVIVLVFLGIARVERGGGEDPAGSILPGEIKAELVLPDGEVILLGEERDASELLATSNTAVADTAYNLLRTPLGGEYGLTLPDGTAVFLNSGSRLRFPVTFSSSERRVELSGEAYFSVKQDAGRPFRVEMSDGAVIEVLGTSFNARVYEDETDARTTLVSGSVRLSTSSATLLLRPGEQGIIDRSGRVTVQEVDVDLYTSWKDGYFSFDRSRLEEVMRDISRWYKVKVIFEDPSLTDISFSGIVRRYGDFNTIIKMLEMTGDTRFIVDGDIIRIRK